MALLRRKDETWDGSERRRPATVLVINDDRDACELLVRFLGQAGYYAVGAYSDLEAISAVHSSVPRCLVLDMTTGGVGSSLKILDQVRSSDDRRISSTRVVLCASSPKNRSYSFQSGADAFLVRPFHIDDLLASIGEVLQRRPEDRARARRAAQQI